MYPELDDFETDHLVSELERRGFRVTAHMPDAIKESILMVQEYCPSVVGVMFFGDTWLYVEANKSAPFAFPVPNEKAPVMEKALAAAQDINDGFCEFFLPLNQGNP